MQYKNRLLGVISCSMVLVGCGGGGGGGSSDSSSPAVSNAQQPAPGPVASTGTTLGFSGVAAIGAPLSNAKIVVKCLSGTASATTDQAGSFVIQVQNAALPCVARATSGNDVLYSATDKEGTFNVTTLTDLMLSSIARNEPSAFYDNFGNSVADLINTTSLQEAQSRVRFALPYMLLSDKTDFVKSKFVADGKDAMDAAMDVIGKGLDAPGKAALRRDLANVETLHYGGSLQADLSAPELSGVNSVTVDPKEPRKFYFTASLSTPVYTNGGTLPETKPIVVIADYARKTLQQFPTSAMGPGLSSTITLDPNTPDRFLSLSVVSGPPAQLALKESKDYGMTWQVASGPNAFQGITPPVEINVRYLRFSVDGSTMFAYSSDENSGFSGGAASYVAISVNGGATWQRPQGFADTQVGPIYVSPSNPNIIYALNNGKLLRSNDKGLNFTALAAMPNASMYTLISPPVSVDPFDANTLYTVSGDASGLNSANGRPLKVYKSADGGQSWKDINLAGCCDTFLPATLAIANRGMNMQKVYLSPTVKGLIYFPFRGDAYNVQMLRSKDGGATWKLLSFSKPAPVTNTTNAPVFMQPSYMPAQIYSTAAREDGGVDIYVRSLSGKGIDRFVDDLGTK